MSPIPSDEALSILIGFPKQRLYRISRDMHNHIDHLLLHDKLKPHKPRPIVSAKNDLRVIQESILKNVFYNRLNPSRYSFGNKGIKCNAEEHLNNRFRLTIDIRNCFPSIKYRHLLDTFRRNGIYGSAINLLIALCTYKEELKQGFSTSPILADSVLSIIDHRIGQCANQMNVIYTRFVDDMSFSAMHDLQEYECGLFRIVVTALIENGFSINTDKTNDTNSASEEVLITKLRMHSNTVNVPKEYFAEYQTIIFDLKSYADGGELQGNYYTQGQMLGKANYIKWINPKRSREVLALMRKVNWKRAEERGAADGLIAYKRTWTEKANTIVNN